MRGRRTYRKRFEKLFSLAVMLDVNQPARAFNWAFQFSSQLIYFMQHAGKRQPEIERVARKQQFRL